MAPCNLQKQTNVSEGKSRSKTSRCKTKCNSDAHAVDVCWVNSGELTGNSTKEKNISSGNHNKRNLAKQNIKVDVEICLKVWNIFGLKQSKINKIKNKSDKFFDDIFETSDFVVFLEMWYERGDPDLFGWDDDFEEVIREYGKRNSKRGRSSGGISFCAKKKLAGDYKILSSDSYRIWLKLNKSLYKGEEDILICILYIPPSDSNWFKSGKSFNFEKLKQEIAFYELQASSIFIIGDYNAQVGTENDYIVNDEIDEFLSLPNNYIIYQMTQKGCPEGYHMIKNLTKGDMHMNLLAFVNLPAIE